jgi:hypothetical protein
MNFLKKRSQIITENSAERRIMLGLDVSYGEGVVKMTIKPQTDFGACSGNGTKHV